MFMSGLFFGGALDHVILALKRSELTPYGIRAGVRGNWGLAALDGMLTVILYLLSRRLDLADDERPKRRFF